MAATRVSRSVGISTYRNFHDTDDVLIADDAHFDYARLSADNWSSIPVFDWHECEGPGRRNDERHTQQRLFELLELSAAPVPAATMHKLQSFTRSKGPSEFVVF
jgi:hypothetical protein